MNSPIERRSSIRRPIHHEAVIKAGSHLSVPGIIADYCQEGMFIKLDNSELSIEDAFVGSIDVCFRDDSGYQFVLQSQVVHEMNGAIGVKFTQAYSRAIQTLNDMNRGGPAVTAKESDYIVEECIICIQKNTHPLFSDFMTALSEDLKQTSVKAVSDQKANAIMAAAEKVDQQRRELEVNFSRGIKDPIGVFEQHVESSTKMNDSLSVVDKGEFEDWLVTRVLITKAETLYRAELLPLKVRLDAIGVGNKDHHQSAFGPALLVTAFHTALATLCFDASIEKQIMKLFEKEVLLKLQELYKSLNDILVRHKILPDLDLAKAVKTQKPISRKKNTLAKPASEQGQMSSAETESGHVGESAPAGSGYSKADSTASGNRTNGSVSPQVGHSSPPRMIDSLGGGSGVADQQNALFKDAPFSSQSGSESQSDLPNSFEQHQADAKSAIDNVVGLMRSLRFKANEQQGLHVASDLAPGHSTDPDQAEASEAAPLFSEQEVVERLDVLQSQVDNISLDEHVPLIARVKDSLDKDKQLEESQKVAIDVVDRFFYSMRNNPRIGSEAKQHLLKLEVPVLKVLLKDDRFFDDHSSSVRAVMNRIAQLGARGSQLNASSKKKVSALVQQIVDQFEQDTQIFDHVLSELDQLVERQNTAYVKNVERVVAAAEGVHKVDEAKQAVASALNQRFQGKKIPAAVTVLVEQGWKDLLTQTHIKHGDESEQWNEYLSVLDRLIAYGENPDIPVDTKRILPIIQDGLKQVSGSNEAPNSVREALKHLIVNAPRKSHTMVDAERYDAPVSEDELVQRNLTQSQELKPWIVKAKSMELGTWFKLERDDKPVQYIRLVWIAKGYSKFVFVNHQGMKVIELGLLKLSKHLKSGAIRPDWEYEQPMVNQSLDDMVKDVYERLAYESSHDKGSGLIKLPEFNRRVKRLMRMGKRTAKCALLYIRFIGEEKQRILLESELAKDVASTLSEQISNSTIGRANESDFVVFVALSENDVDFDQLKPALLTLYGKDCGVADIIVGESRAHLGFNNPDSMIEHAMANAGILSVTNSERKVEPAQSATGASEDISALEESIEAPEAIDVTVGANDDQTEPSFGDLNLSIQKQKTRRVSDSIFASGNQSEVNDAEGLDQDNPKPSQSAKPSHVNLVCFLDDKQEFEALTEEDMKSLDYWWLAQLQELTDEKHPILNDYEFVRLKLSAYALMDESYIAQLSKLAESGRLSAGAICFDIYEGSAIDDIHEVHESMNGLIKLGYRFCLDHFGSERSPFAFLKALPFFMINIDESFVKSLSDEDGSEIAADSIAEVAHYLGKKVLATAVDSAICAQKMTKLKVDFIQGTTVSRFEKL